MLDKRGRVVMHRVIDPAAAALVDWIIGMVEGLGSIIQNAGAIVRSQLRWPVAQRIENTNRVCVGHLAPDVIG